jgi:hypothetical protein
MCADPCLTVCVLMCPPGKTYVLILECFLAQVLLLVLRLWPRVPADVADTWPLLPKQATPPPPDFFTGGASRGPAEPLPGAAALFSPAHLKSLLPALRQTSSAHPRLHQSWPTMLALLLPGFALNKVVPERTVFA